MIDINRISGIIRYYASIPVAILSLSTLAMFVIIRYRSILGPVLGAVFGAFMGIILLHLRTTGRHQQIELDYTLPDYRLAVIVSSLYISVLIWTYRFTLHERPAVHYLAFGGFAGYVAYEIAVGASRHRILPQLLILTFFTYWSVQFAFPLGMFNADTHYRYVPVIRSALVEGNIEGWGIYLGHLVHVLEATLVTGLSPQMGYYLLAVLILTSTILIIGILDRILPAISKRVSLFAALFFGCMSWTLGRGFHPSKLSFFYGVTLLLGFVVIIQYIGPTQRRHRWTFVGVITAPAIIFGHQYSAGAAMIFLLTLSTFFIGTAINPWSPYKRAKIGSVIGFVAAYVIGILGNPIHQTALSRRFVGIVTAVSASGGGSGSGGPGRYSTVPLELLLLSTAGQAILFGLGIFGAAIAIRRVEWEFDMGIFWMGILALFLAFSLVFNAADTQPQRLYSLLGLFGLNVFAGVALVWLLRSEKTWFSPRSVGLVIFVFALLSLGSPVAGVHLSFVGDDVPHNRLYESSQLTSGEEWVTGFQGNEETTLNTNPSNTELPYERESSLTATVNSSRITNGYRYVYTTSASSTGVITDSGLGLGGRQFVFLTYNPSPTHDIIYKNGETTVYVARSAEG